MCFLFWVGGWGAKLQGFARFDGGVSGKRNNPFGIPFGISLIAELKIGVN